MTGTSTSMRERFTAVTARALAEDPRTALVLADIGVAPFAELGLVAGHHPRVINVGIREQLLVSVAAGLALAGLRPIAHTYAPFLVERAFEQIKLDLGHQDLGAVLVSVGASYDASASGRTHQAPGDVALLRTIPGLTVHVPGHADEVERLLREAIAGDHRVYVRLSEERNRVAHDPHRVVPLRDAGPGAPLLLAVGPSLDPALAATADLAISVAYAATVRPLDAAGLRRAATGSDVVLVEPYLSGSSLPEVMRALGDRPRRLLALGIEQVELRRYGTPAEHRAAHGLDAAGLRRSLHAFAADARAATP